MQLLIAKLVLGAPGLPVAAMLRELAPRASKQQFDRKDPKTNREELGQLGESAGLSTSGIWVGAQRLGLEDVSKRRHPSKNGTELPAQLHPYGPNNHPTLQQVAIRKLRPRLLTECESISLTNR